MEEIKLSKKGNELIRLYEEMAVKGFDRKNGPRKEKAYDDFQLTKFRHVCKKQISNERIKTVLDYGGEARIGMPQALILKQISLQSNFLKYRRYKLLNLRED